MPLHRSRSGRAPPCAEGPQREPFSAGPFRQKATSSPSTTPARKGRQYGENQPPENVNLVRGNILEVASPALLKSASRKGKGHLASPALPPMPPSARASPAQAGYQPASAALLDTGAKRKLSWEVQSAGATEIAPTPDQKTAIASVTEANVADNGVKVIVRVRPLTHREQQEGEIEALSVSPQTISLAQQTFTFDAVARSEATQNDLFNMVGIPMVNNCIAGFNSSIFAYGQTGSGKTYTMWGPTQDSISNIFPNESRGIAPRLFEQLFSRIQQEEIKHAASQLRYQCRCSFLEIYNEQITDLLEPSQKNLQIREDTKTGVYVENLTEEFVSGVNDITQLLLKGLANRSVGSTMMNNESSRSHSVFTCVIECRCKSVEEGVSSLRSSRMNLVDLAGSERQKQTGAAGERLKEAGNINRSLSQLGNVINILAEVAQSGKQRHIPYRDSRLTFLLQESLGGNAKLAMICSISTASSCRSETLSTLRFAKRAKAIQNKAVVNEETENDVNLLREQIRQLKEELMRMKSSKAEQPSGWNPRRSYNLLRMSLNYPMAFPKGDLDSDSDEEMEIEDPVCQEHTEGLVSQESGRTDRAIRDQIMEIEHNPADVPVCQGPGSVDGAIDEEIMEIDDDSAQVPICQVPAGLDGATCEEIMDIEEDSADVPVYQEPGSADGGIGEQSALMDLGSPFPDDSPSRLPLLGDHTRMGSCRLAESQPYYDCKSVFDSCSHISLSGSFSSSSKYSSSVIPFPVKSQVEPTMPRGYGGLDSVTTSEAGIVARRSSLPDQLPGELEDTLCSKMVCTSSVAIEDSPMMQQESRIQLNQAKEELSYAGVPPTSVDAGLHVEASTSSEDAGPEELPGNIDNPLALDTVSAPQRNLDTVQESLDDQQRRQSLMSKRSIEALTIVEVPATSQVASCVEASVTSEEAVVQSLHVVLPTLPLCAECLSDTVEDPVGRGNFSLSHGRLVELVDPAAQECPILLDESIEAFTCVEETTAGEDPAICVQAFGLSDDEGTACLEMVLPMSVLKPAQLPHVYEEVAHMECSERTQDTEQVQQCPRFLNECVEELTFSEDPTANQDGAICVEAFAAGEDAALASLEMVVPAAQELQHPILVSESIEASSCAEETSAGKDPAICVQASGLTEDEGTACLEMVLLTSALKAEQLPHVYEEVAHMECPETTQDTEGEQQCLRLLTECIEDTKDPEDPTANPDGVISVEALAAGEDVTLASLDLSYQSIEAFACAEGTTAGEDPAICVQASTLSDDEVTACLEMVLPTSPLKPEQLPHVYEEVAHMECPETTQDTDGVQQCPRLLTEWIEDTKDPEDPTANHDGAICVEAFAAGEDVTPASLEMVAPVAQELQSPILVSESIEGFEALSCAKDPSAIQDDTAICVEASGLSEDAIVLSLEVVVPTSPFGPEQLLDAYEDPSSVRQTECPTATQDADQVQQFSSSVNESIEPLTCTEDPSDNEDTSNCVETSGDLEETMLPSFEMGLPTSPPRVVVLASPTGMADPSDKLRYTRGAGTICTVGEVPTLQTRTQTQLNKAVEALLAGAIRREEAAEEKVRRQAAEIEQLNRLVRQYKHERECNAILQQSREDKIARLESLMDGVLPSDAFLAHEWAALTNEHQVLLDKYDNHPEVTHSIIQQQRLIEELREYRDYFDLGEKEDMQKEIRQLRKQLQDFLDSGPPPRPLDSRRRSMLMQSISVRQSMSLRQSMCLRSSVAAPGALAICTDPKRFDESIGRLSEDLIMVVSEELYPETKKTTLQDDMKQLVGEQGLEGPLSPVGECSLVVTETQCPEDKDREWEERENDWIAVLEELRLEADSYRRQAEMRTHELECERRCSEEVREALQMAMTGHARLLDQYAELQEKHISVLAKHRKIREGASDVKKMAKRAGVSQVDSRWLETQATKMAAMQADHEEERESMRQDIESLRAQLNDTAEAVQAAGELLVRLKESEEAVCIAQDAALLAAQDADALQRELEKAKRKHATEIAVLQQRLLESRLQKSTLCQMCVMAERVKFEFTEVDENTAQAEMEAEQRAAALQQVDQMAAAGQESAEEEHWVQSPVRYAHSADDWDYQSPARDNDPAAESRYDYYLDDYERGWRR